MIPDIIGKPHTWCYKFLGWRLKLTKSAFRRISQLKLVPAPGHWSGRRCLGSGRLRVSELAAGSLAAAYLGLETPQTGCMQCCSYLSGLQRFTDHTQHTSCLCKTSHPLNPLRGFTGAHCCRGGYQGIRGGYCSLWPGAGCCRVTRYCVLQCVWSPPCCCHYYSRPGGQAAGRHRRLLQCLARPAAVPV